MTPDSPSQIHSQSTSLDPDYRLAVAILCLALLLWKISLWVTVGVGAFGLFLCLQTYLLRLVFSPTSLLVYRGEQVIREFPYQDWQHWDIYRSEIPVLFYFREVKSIHFLPIIFNPAQLKTSLLTYVGSPNPDLTTFTPLKKDPIHPEESV